MQIAQIQVVFWDKTYISQVGDFVLVPGDQVVIKTDWGTEAGKVVAFTEVPEENLAKRSEDVAPIIRKVTTEDYETLAGLDKQRPFALDFCKKAVARQSLPMKVIDAHFSFDGSRLVFPFIADGRIDFRQLVKDLTHHFQKSVRLQQIGIRDEAKISGDIGSCGRTLCCKTHLKELVSITSDLADIQQVAHRGSERLSGLCGRLRCCLAFEGKTYFELSKKLPAIGTKVRTEQGRGKIVGWNILKQTVDVDLEGEGRNIVEIPIK